MVNNCLIIHSITLLTPEELVSQCQNSSENEAFIKIFGKEYPGYV